jgi:DnaJ-class molecular chaperone
MVQVQVEIPTKLNKQQREALQTFADTIGVKNSPMHESFFKKAKRFFS